MPLWSPGLIKLFMKELARFAIQGSPTALSCSLFGFSKLMLLKQPDTTTPYMFQWVTTRHYMIVSYDPDELQILMFTKLSQIITITATL